MKKIYISPETDVLKNFVDVQPLMLSALKWYNSDGTPADSSTPGGSTGTGDLDTGGGETFAKKHIFEDFNSGNEQFNDKLVNF